MNNIRRFVGWVALNPIRFTVWFALSCASGAILAIYTAPWWLVVGFFAVLALSCYLDIKAMPLVLSLAIAIPATAQEPDPDKGMYGVAVVVVVVGGVATYCLVRTCQKLFPKSPKGGTNEPPYVMPGGTPDCAGSWTYTGWVSCYTPQVNLNGAAPLPMVNLELTGAVGSNGELRLSAGRQLADDELLDGADFQKNLAEHGITFGQIGEKSYGLWGRPAYPEEVPIVFTEDASGNKGAMVVSAAPMVSVALERSPDLVRWSRITTSSLAVGSPLRIIDSTTSGQMFYRLRGL